MNRNLIRPTSRFWNQRPVLYVAGGIALLVLLLIVALAFRAHRVIAGGFYTVKKGTLRIVITEDGTLAAKESMNVVADIEAQAKIVWIIDEGSFVEKDAKLVELDKTQLEDYLESLELDLITLKANYLSAKGRLDVLKAEGPQQLERLRFEVKKAQARLDKAIAQQPKEEHRSVYSESELTDAKIAVDEAQMNLESAKLARDLYENYTYPQELSEADADFERMDRIYHSKLAKETEVTEQLAKMELVAPSDGLVIYGAGNDERRRWGSDDDQIKVGATVFKGQTVITLPNVTKMQAQIRVHEADFLKVKKDLHATIRVHAFPGKELTGRVATIGALARERDWRSQGVRVFDVSIDIDGEHPFLRPGLTARVDILVNEVTDVLLVPVEAVFVEPGTNQRFCYVRTASGHVKRPVTLGMSNNNFVVVTEGLQANDQVYQYDPTATAD